MVIVSPEEQKCLIMNAVAMRHPDGVLQSDLEKLDKDFKAARLKNAMYKLAL